MIYEMNYIWTAEMKWNEMKEIQVMKRWKSQAYDWEKKWQVLFPAVRVSPKTVVLLIKIKTEKSVSSVN